MGTPSRPPGSPTLLRRAAAEGVATSLLLAIVVGSGIMGSRLSDGSVALALLANSLATGAGLAALLLGFGAISGAHLNPVVTLTEALDGRQPWSEVPAYCGAQIVGAFAGVALAHGMFEEAVFSVSRRSRGGGGQLLSEFVATFGLLLILWGCRRRRPESVAFAVGAYIAAAYWFTASTSFANPAVTLARSATDSFTGVRPAETPSFVGAQLLGAAAALAIWRWLTVEPRSRAVAEAEAPVDPKLGPARPRPES